jgi:hypothetical protein
VRPPHTAGIRMVPHLPGDPWGPSSTTAWRLWGHLLHRLLPQRQLRTKPCMPVIWGRRRACRQYSPWWRHGVYPRCWPRGPGLPLAPIRLSPASRMLRECFADASRMLRGCFADASRMLRGCFADASTDAFWRRVALLPWPPRSPSAAPLSPMFDRVGSQPPRKIQAVPEPRESLDRARTEPRRSPDRGGDRDRNSGPWRFARF